MKIRKQFLKSSIKFLVMRQSIIIILIIFITELKAQEPVIAWQQTIGGSGLDYFKSCNQTSDNGYIIGGYSYSEISGDKTEGNIGSADYWVLKLDSVGDIEWQNTIGGASTDFLASVEQTFDGGYIIGGYSKSGASGDKTELNFIGGEGYDYWIVKLNALGSIEWQNTIGGNNDDFLVSTHQTMDGGYIIGGYSSSTLSGDKSEGNMGGAGTKDYWILKLNSSGSIIWQNTIGADGNDVLAEIRETAEGNYIVGGYSDSKKNGDKTIKRWGSLSDYWVMQLNSSGTIMWQNVFGGLDSDLLTSVIQLADGGFLFGGYSDSDITGNKSKHLYVGSHTDYWLVKTDALGNIIWDKVLGGSENEIITSMTETAGQNLLIAGYSISPSSFDKLEPTQGLEDYWILELDNSGKTLWENDLGGILNERPYAIGNTQDGGFFVLGYSASLISGDKTEVGSGSIDGWMLKFNPSNCISGPYYFDFDMDNAGDVTTAFNACELTYLYVENSTDCNPLHSNQNPLAPEVCDGIDNNCDGLIDEGIFGCNPGPDVIWQNTIGGVESDNIADIHPTSDGGYILIAGSDSDISGDKNANSKGAIDYWIVKLDAIGNITWQKTIGGSGNDWPKCISQTTDGGYIAGGYSSSGISGDKNEASLGGDDFWIIKLDALGNIEWQNTIGGNSTDLLNDLNQTLDGGFIAGGSSFSGISGDKTTPNAANDGWILKLNATGSIEWQKSIRGNLFDILDNIKQTTDGGYIAGLYSESGIGLDKTAPSQGAYDYWIVKLDASGNIMWQNTIGGGAGDYLYAVSQLSDGSYIVGGTSFSSASGNKTEVLIGGSDLWIVKLDISGNLVWQNTIGGSGNDWPKCISQTTDGGYIAGGYSSSGISGDKNEASLGGDDFWIIKLDALGNIEWQNTIGGNSTDLLNDLNQTLDGGFIAGGSSFSGISGDKTTPNAANDGWILKLNATGSIEWQKSIRGNLFDILDNIKQTTDGGYIAGLYSESGIGLDKTAPSQGAYDYWIVKLDASGNIMWQNTIGGGAGDYLYAVSQLSDGSYIVGGTSFSSASGNKTEVLIGGSDLWIVKLDISGNLVWQNTIGGADLDGLNAIRATQDNGFIIGGFSWSDISGDKVENKIIGGVEDAWIMKLNSEGEIVWQNAIGGNNNDFCINIEQCFDGTFIAGVSSGSELSGDKNENTPANVDSWIIKFDIDCVPVTEICNSIDDNCNGNIDENITETISISAGGPTTFCQGGNVLLTAIYSGATVQWKKNGTNIPGATSPTYLVTTKGTYTCETTSICGTATAVGIFVNVNKNPPATITAGGPTNFCAGGSVILTANTGGGLSYQWYKGATPIAGATSLTYTATTSGNYKCRVTKTATGCFKNSNTIVVSVPCKEGEDVLPNITLNIQPNPNNGTFTISANSLSPLETAHLLIYNTTGQQIFTRELDPQQDIFEINMPEIPTGMYIVKLVSGTNIYEQKLIIE
jgi:hypothetical protein